MLITIILPLWPNMTVPVTKTGNAVLQRILTASSELVKITFLKGNWSHMARVRGLELLQSEGCLKASVGSVQADPALKMFWAPKSYRCSFVERSSSKILNIFWAPKSYKSLWPKSDLPVNKTGQCTRDDFLAQATISILSKRRADDKVTRELYSPSHHHQPAFFTRIETDVVFMDNHMFIFHHYANRNKTFWNGEKNTPG